MAPIPFFRHNAAPASNKFELVGEQSQRASRADRAHLFLPHIGEFGDLSLHELLEYAAILDKRYIPLQSLPHKKGRINSKVTETTEAAFVGTVPTDSPQCTRTKIESDVRRPIALGKSVINKCRHLTGDAPMCVVSSYLLPLEIFGSFRGVKPLQPHFGKLFSYGMDRK